MLLSFLLITNFIASLYAQQQKLDPLYRISTIAGGGFDDGLDAGDVALAPTKVKIDKNYNIYVSGEFELLVI